MLFRVSSFITDGGVVLPRRAVFRIPRMAGVFALAVGLCAIRLAAAPKLFPVSGLPEQQQQYWSATQLGSGWIAGTANGLVLQENTGWKSVRPPASGYVTAIESYDGGLAVAGDGFLFRYAGGDWHQVDTRETFTSAIAVKDRVLLASSKLIAELDARGTLRVLLRLPGDFSVRIHRVGTNILVLPERGTPLVWRDGALVDAKDRLPWAAGIDVVSIEALAEDRFLVASSRGIFETEGTEPRPLLPALREQLRGEGIIGAFRFGDIHVIATFAGGLRLFRGDSTTPEWTARAEEIGSVYFARRIEGGLLVGTSARLHVLPDPSRFSYTRLPGLGDFHFTGDAITGPVVGLSTGVHRTDGTAVPAPSAVFSSLVTSTGDQIWGAVGSILVHGAQVPVGGGEILRLIETSPGRLAVLQPHKFWLADTSNIAVPVRSISLEAMANSMAVGQDGYVIGTSDGVIHLSLDLTRQNQVGSGRIRVKRQAGETVLMDASGALLSERGDLLLRLPNAEVLDVAVWRGQWWVLAKFPDQSTWIGRWARENNTWVPQDCPVSPSATALVSDGDALVVVTPRELMAVRELEPLTLPPFNITVADTGEIPLPASPLLPVDQDSVTLLFGGQRLPPWNSPTYAIRVGDGRWEEPQRLSRQSVTRLGWGKTNVQVRRLYGADSAEGSVMIARRWPVWLRWPAIVLYGACLGGLGFVVVSWRTQALRKRAERLERLVEQRTAELKKAQRAREDFFSSVSHEIRNPLNGVVGICDILSKVDLADTRRARRHILTLRGCADQLRSILDDVLDFARIDRGEIRVYDEPFDLPLAIDGAARSVDPGLAKTSLSMPEGELFVRGDVGKVRQVVTNLVSNALKYGVPSAAKVTLAVTAGPAIGTVVARVAVSNTGPSLSKEDLSRLFTEFSRGHDAVRRKIAGTGLGLAVSKKMAEAMHGSLTVTSEGGLTEFVLQLPLQRCEAPDDEEGESLAPLAERSKALAIEDEEYNRTVLGFHLQELGYEVDWAVDGAHALEYANESSYDLILTDFELPDTTGNKLAAKLLEMIPAPKPPIIAVTAYSTPEKIAEAKAAGIKGFVTKPVSKRKIREAIIAATADVVIKHRVDEPTRHAYRLNVFDKLQDPRAMLAHYADAVDADWKAIAGRLTSGFVGDEMRKQVHAYRSRVLIVHAQELAEQLQALEGLLTDTPDVTEINRLIPLVTPLVADLSRKARDRALS